MSRKNSGWWKAAIYHKPSSMFYVLSYFFRNYFRVAYLSSIVDWQAKYGHPVHALETFVESDRFRGTCYRAANWLRLGKTQGRTRNDRNHCLRATVKDVYLYPLSPDFRRELCA